MEHASLKDVNEWWGLLQEDFKRLNQNYQDYLRDFYSGKTDHLMKCLPVMEETILEKVVQSELDIPHALLEIRGNAEPSIRENVMGKSYQLRYFSGGLL